MTDLFFFFNDRNGQRPTYLDFQSHQFWKFQSKISSFQLNHSNQQIYLQEVNMHKSFRFMFNLHLKFVLLTSSNPSWLCWRLMKLGWRFENRQIYRCLLAVVHRPLLLNFPLPKYTNCSTHEDFRHLGNYTGGDGTNSLSLLHKLCLASDS